MRGYPSDGDSLKPTTTENWHPMWGLWLVTETQHQPYAVGQPPDGRPQSRTKIDFSLQDNTSEHTTLAGQQTGQPQQCTMPSQVLQRQCSSVPYHQQHIDDSTAFRGSAHLMSGDVGSDKA